MHSAAFRSVAVCKRKRENCERKYWWLCNLHCSCGTCPDTHTQPTVYCHMQSLHRVLPHAPCVLLSVALSCSTEPCWCRAVHGGQRAEAPACQRLQECLQLHHSPPAWERGLTEGETAQVGTRHVHCNGYISTVCVFIHNLACVLCVCVCAGRESSQRVFPQRTVNSSSQWRHLARALYTVLLVLCSFIVVDQLCGLVI